MRTMSINYNMNIRALGVLLHVTSLPAKKGQGVLGKEAFEFIDWLASSGVKYWQVLPLGPVDSFGSPYSPSSVFAGNPALIDLEGESSLAALYKKGYDKAALKEFARENKYWIDSYVEYNTQIKLKHNLEKEYFIFEQMKFFEQWSAIKKYANEKGIRIIGDVPIYPAMESADVWARPEQFDITNGKPNGVAGVPPDYFDPEGQLWGSPLYNWKQMTKDRFKWWCERIKHLAKLTDVLRIDHFRAFDSYFSIPPGATPREGKWFNGPGIKFFNAIKKAAPNAEFILEDLGDINDSVRKLAEEVGDPCMRVMQFGIDGNEHVPDNYIPNCVAYLGTHDNDTFVGFLKTALPQTRLYIEEYLGSYRLGFVETAKLAIEKVMQSKANLVVLSMQDLLLQGGESRMNMPGTVGGRNWKYQARSVDFSPRLAQYIRSLCEVTGRV